MIEGMKPQYNAALKPFARLCASVNISPNMLTLTGLALFAVASWLTAIGYWRTALGVGLIGACMDGLDGVLARETNQKTTFGAILDSVCDRFTEIFWLCGILAFYVLRDILTPTILFLSLSAITGSLMVSYVKARAEGAGVVCKEGILQRPERLIALAIFQLIGPVAMVWGLGFVAFFAYITVFQRMRTIWKACN
ncbi:MAG: CDP-alcohol phosphatidyltransferase family protein [Chitinivibrionales bacterium]|nr:CDP-alcohol phosphatidyltransferase family protein [Chitinivibrionales bacterium]